MSELDDDAIERLVLAAPEMLELLKEVAGGYDGWDGDEQRANEFSGLAYAAQQLLAKIEGGEA